MARKIFMTAFFFFTFALLNFNSVKASINTNEEIRKYAVEDLMFDFIPNNLDYIRYLIIKAKNVNAKFFNKDIIVLVYKTLNKDSKDYRALEIRVPFTIFIFEAEKTESYKDKDTDQIIREVIADFLDGKNNNIKYIFWSNNGKPYSWSRKIRKLREEKTCRCNCVEGRFSKRICLHENCPMKKKINSFSKSLKRKGGENGNF